MEDKLMEKFEKIQGCQERLDLWNETFGNLALEGFEPTPEFLAHKEAYVNGEMTMEDIIFKIHGIKTD